MNHNSNYLFDFTHKKALTFLIEKKVNAFSIWTINSEVPDKITYLSISTVITCLKRCIYAQTFSKTFVCVRSGPTEKVHSGRPTSSDTRST